MKLAAEVGVEKATADQCQYGSEDAKGSPIKKPTTFLTNSPELAKELRGDAQASKATAAGKKEDNTRSVEV